ncbi:hypothetical protein [Rheinheimera sp. WS51]|uniref:hypothetical protein n=1 Tax=Rheinheimera sp. WS51 TaxID=3425886 RepID=UPI003D8ECB61
MEPIDNKEVKSTQASRRKFLLHVGIGSLPVLLTLKSKAAWGTSTLNCSLSENASQMQSVQPEKYEACKQGLDSHGSAKRYFDNVSTLVAGGKGGYFYKPKHITIAAWSKQWNGIKIYQDTKFSDVFDGSFTGTLDEAVNLKKSNSLLRNITAAFLHSLYYQETGQSSNFPEPYEIVNAYLNSVTTAQKQQLDALLVYYIDGKT